MKKVIASLVIFVLLTPAISWACPVLPPATPAVVACSAGGGPPLIMIAIAWIVGWYVVINIHSHMGYSKNKVCEFNQENTHKDSNNPAPGVNR